MPSGLVLDRLTAGAVAAERVDPGADITSAKLGQRALPSAGSMSRVKYGRYSAKVSRSMSYRCRGAAESTRRPSVPVGSFDKPFDQCGSYRIRGTDLHVLLWSCRESNPGPTAFPQGFSVRSSLCLYSDLLVSRTSQDDDPSRCLMSPRVPRPNPWVGPSS